MIHLKYSIYLLEMGEREGGREKEQREEREKERGEDGGDRHARIYYSRFHIPAVASNSIS